MIIDAATVPGGATVETDICIIGGGPAGISLALEFESQPFRVILLEAGKLKRERAVQALYKGDSIGVHYEDLDQARSRFLGGSSNCWGGFSRPLDAEDFEVRDWVPNSGWPIQRSDLMPYYRRAHELLQLGPFEYAPDIWEGWIGRRDARLLPLTGDRVSNVICQISPPTRFGRQYRANLERSRNIITYLNANVTEIETPDSGVRVTAVGVRTLAGASFKVAAKTYVLATGGIETPRLLLASNRYQAAGIGNQYDLVGRYFMDHPRLRRGAIQFLNPSANSAIYDLHVTLPGGIKARGVKVAAYFGLTPETRRAERLGNTRCYAISRFVGENPASYAAASQLHRALTGSSSLLERSGPELLNIVKQLPMVAVLALSLKSRLPFLARGFSLETVVEPTPLRDSRVTLGHDRDSLGMPRAKVEWQLGELEKRTMRRTQEILAEDIKRAGGGTISVETLADHEPWPDTLRGCWHHMGTARMADDPHRGVVDAQCRVHGMENLFIGGSSVFPTCGCDMPTITVVAMSIRIADHIKASYFERRIDEVGGGGLRHVSTAA